MAGINEPDDLRFEISGEVLWREGDGRIYAPKTTRILESAGGMFTYLERKGWGWGGEIMGPVVRTSRLRDSIKAICMRPDLSTLTSLIKTVET